MLLNSCSINDCNTYDHRVHKVYALITFMCVKISCHDVTPDELGMYRVFHKKTPPFIFGYNSHNNGPICIKFAANIR